MSQPIRWGLTAIVALAGSTVATAVPSPSATEAQAILKRCGGDEAHLAALPEAQWRIVIPSALPHHLELRNALGATMPSAPAMVTIYADGGDLETTVYSVVLMRSADGSWNGSAVGRSQIWVKDAPWQPIPPRQWTLTAEAGRRLDAILADRCFYAEPAEPRDNSHAPSVGSLGMVIETKTPQQSRIAFTYGNELIGLLKALQSLATPPKP